MIWGNFPEKHDNPQPSVILPCKAPTWSPSLSLFLSLSMSRDWEHGVHILTEASFHYMKSLPCFTLCLFFFLALSAHAWLLFSIFPLLSFLHPHTSGEWYNRRRSGVVHTEETSPGETVKTGRWRTEQEQKTERRWDSREEKVRQTWLHRGGKQKTEHQTEREGKRKRERGGGIIIHQVFGSAWQNRKLISALCVHQLQSQAS